MTRRIFSFLPWALFSGALVMALPLGEQKPAVQAEAPVTDPALRARVENLERENRDLRASLDGLDSLAARLEALRERAERTEQRFEDVALSVQAYPIPDEVVFCGERLPLERPEVHMRFEEQWLRFLVNRHWLLTWQRRAREVFPVIERELASAGLPDDLKYVMVIESGVNPRAVSSAGAVGWWQFMESTGKRYGLERGGHLDERRDVVLATRAAIDYMREMHEEFESWPLVLAGYNAGENRVRNSIEDQGTRDYYHMVLPSETEDYWFKAAATKVLLSQPERYGLELPHDGWAPVLCDTLELEIDSPRIDLKDLAATAGISYGELKAFNPWFRKAWLPHGEHKLVLPRTSVASVMAAYPEVEVVARAERADGERRQADETSPATEARGAVPRDQ